MHTGVVREPLKPASLALFLPANYLVMRSGSIVQFDAMIENSDLGIHFLVRITNIFMLIFKTFYFFALAPDLNFI